MLTPPGSICHEIRKLRERPDEQPQKPWIRNCVGSRAKSSECGCRCCYVACEAVTRDAGARKRANDNLDAMIRNSGLQFDYGGSSISEYFVLNPADDPVLPISASISGYTGSEQCFRTAWKWLEDCVKTHRTLCSTFFTSGMSKLPPRVIDVNPAKSGFVRLVQTNQEEGPYACLSHCWGGEQPLKTTLKTLSLYQQGIQWKQLPKTFQEAILVARRFGFQYLWIDSLCIIQDDDADWQVQSAQMGQIYRNSVITIAGSASSGPFQGLFRKADPTHLDHGFSNIAASRGLDEIRTRKPLAHQIGNLPLLQRGWVFQERLLSPRYLHFGEHELIWECMECMTCECGRLSLSDPERFGWLEPKNRLHPVSLQFLNDSPYGISRTWQATVHDYWCLQLTRPSDIFPALSGLANSIREATGWEYVAGLWKESLIVDLTWTVSGPEFITRCKKWRAPTFSWASVIASDEQTSKDIPSAVDYGLAKIIAKGIDDTGGKRWRADFHATVMETRCIPININGDATGQLESGYIVLRGTLVQAELRCMMPKKRWKIAPIGKEAQESGKLYMDYDFDNAGCGLRDGDIVFCLKLIGLSMIPQHGCGEYLLYLVLRKINSEPWASDPLKGGREFERVGIFRDAYDYDAVQLEEESEEFAIERNSLVKIL